MKKNEERKNSQRQKKQDLKASLERPLSKSNSKNTSQAQSKRSSNKEQAFEDGKSQKSKQSSISPSKSSRPTSKGGKQPLDESKVKKSNLKKPSENLNLINTLNPPTEGIKPQNLKQILLVKYSHLLISLNGLAQYVKRHFEVKQREHFQH